MCILYYSAQILDRNSLGGKLPLIRNLVFQKKKLEPLGGKLPLVHYLVFQKKGKMDVFGYDFFLRMGRLFREGAFGTVFDIHRVGNLVLVH